MYLTRYSWLHDCQYELQWLLDSCTIITDPQYDYGYNTWLIDWLYGFVTIWLYGYMNIRLVMAVWLVVWRFDCLYDCLIVWLYEIIADYMTWIFDYMASCRFWLYKWKTVLLYEYVTGYITSCMTIWLYHWLHD